MQTIKAQIYDVVEAHTRRGTERSVQGVRVYGVAADGRVVTTLVVDVPHEIYVDPERITVSPPDQVRELNAWLLRNQTPCRRTECENGCGSKAGGAEWAPCYEACAKDRRTDEEAVLGVDFVWRRGFEVYEESARLFWRFRLSRSYYAKSVKKFFEGKEVDVYDCCTDAVNSFVQLKNFAGFEWYEWPAGEAVSFDDFRPAEWAGMAPLRHVVFDIETIAQKYNDADSENALYPVGCVCVDGGGGGAGRRAYVLGAPESVDVSLLPPDLRLLCFESELEMLRALKENELAGAQLWSGWNSDGYDLRYVFKRGEVLGDPQFRAFRDGRVVRFAHDSHTDERKVYCPGVVSLDYCKVVERDTRVRPYDYKLNTIAEHFGLGEKDDMPYTELWNAFHGGPQTKAKLVKYCAQDVELTKQIGKKIGAVIKLVAKSRVKRVRPQDELYRGASFVSSRKVKEYLRGEFLMLSRRETYGKNAITGEQVRKFALCRALSEVQGYVDKVHERGYTGGFVRAPVTGAYTNFSVGTLDFNSLYPSIMRTHNMCRSTQLKRPGQLGGGDKEWVSTSGFAFAQHREGVYPKIMREMVEERTKVRTKMKSVADKDELEQMEAYQTELKIVANGLYGLTGADSSELVLKSAAQCTCQRGAELAQLACHVIDEDPALPPDWSPAEREEYFGRTRAYESSLSKSGLLRFRLARQRFKVVMGLKVIYGDTDSLMIWFAKSSGAARTFEWLTEVAQYVNKESGILPGVILKMGMEDVSNMALCGKKMYVKYKSSVEDGVLEKPKIKICGMDNRSKAPYVRERLRAMFEAALKDGADIAPMYQETIRTVSLGQLPYRQMRHTTKLNKPPGEYANEAHAVAARQMEAAGLCVRVGDRIEYYRCLITGARANGTKAETVVAQPFVESGEYDLDWRAYALETVEALKPLWPLIPNCAAMSRMENYAVSVGCKRLPPAQLNPGGMVGGGSKRVVMTAQAGPMDAFVKRTASARPRPQPKVRTSASRGRTFDQLLLTNAGGAAAVSRE